jgi:hypothetical protein
MVFYAVPVISKERWRIVLGRTSSFFMVRLTTLSIIQTVGLLRPMVGWRCKDLKGRGYNLSWHLPGWLRKFTTECVKMAGRWAEWILLTSDTIINITKNALIFELYLSIYLSMALQSFFSFLILGRGISQAKGRYLHTEQHKHRINAQRHPCFLSGIRTHDSSVVASDDSLCLTPRHHCHRLFNF